MLLEFDEISELQAEIFVMVHLSGVFYSKAG